MKLLEGNNESESLRLRTGYITGTKSRLGINAAKVK